jgi:hypothetical protein
MLIIGTLPFYGQKLRLGVTTGLNLSTFSEPGNLYDNQDIKTGFGGGLSLDLSIGKAFGLQSGLLYEQKGFSRKEQIASGDEHFTGMYNYLTIPLLAEGSCSISGNNRLYGLTGVYAGFKTYSENAIGISNPEAPVQSDQDINDTDAGWIIGGGVQIPAGNHLMQIGFRYSLGLAEVSKISKDDRNKSVLISATLFF